MIIFNVCNKGIFNPLAKLQKPAITPKSCKDAFVKSNAQTYPEELRSIFYKLYRKDMMFSCTKKYFEDLYASGKEKFDFILGHKAFGTDIPFYNETEFITALKKMPINEIEKTFNEIRKLYERFSKDINIHYKVNSEPSIYNYAQLTILKSGNRQTYEYIMKNTDTKSMYELLEIFPERLNGSAFETLTIPQIRQITGKGIKLQLTEDKEKMKKIFSNGLQAEENYVLSSDSFSHDADGIDMFSKYLSHSKVTEPFTAFRAEKDTGMFSSVMLDKVTGLKTKWFVLKNIFKAKKVKIHEYEGKFTDVCSQKINLFNYIIGKKQLTLADAMQAAKYGSTKYQNKIAEMIKKSKIQDDRFKSLTFDFGVAKEWLPSQETQNTGILHNVNIKEGIEGAYSHTNNRQAEFILNNTQKSITFDNVRYNPEQDIWYFDSTISPI